MLLGEAPCTLSWQSLMMLFNRSISDSLSDLVQHLAFSILLDSQEPSQISKKMRLRKRVLVLASVASYFVLLTTTSHLEDLVWKSVQDTWKSLGICQVTPSTPASCHAWLCSTVIDISYTAHLPCLSLSCPGIQAAWGKCWIHPVYCCFLSISTRVQHVVGVQ